MKYLAPFILAVSFLASCTESPIEIPEIQAGNRNVLVEELTGVRCQGCPAGSAELVRLDSIYGENLVVVSVHAADVFSFPYAESTHDFRSPKAEELVAYLGEYSAFPTSSINRHVFPPNTSPFLLNTGSWGGFIGQELAKPASVSLSLTTEYNPDNRKATIDVKIAPEATLFGEFRISVMITEDKIIDPQQVGITLVPEYTHRHVLRDIVTAPTGNVLTEGLVAGSILEKSFEVEFPAEWVADHCSIVAFVHKNTGSDKDVLQVVEEHIHE